MSHLTRRKVMQGSLALAGAVAAPRLALGQNGGSRTITAVGVDLTSYDPVVTTAFSTTYHAAKVYDTLFGLDLQQRPQPQMVSRYELSDDKLTWTFELRDGLKFHDGAAVTSADVIPSIRRWAARSSLGQLMMMHVKDISARDSKTFSIQLKERFGLVVEGLAGSSIGPCFIMRKKEAETDPAQKIDAVIGSGPFKFNLAETKPGAKYVYDMNSDYVPRSEPPSGMAGGKVVKIDRLTYLPMPDAQTAIAAIQAGEVDFYDEPPIDLLEQLSRDKNVKLQVVDQLGQNGVLRFNHLHPPFNNVKCRQAILYIVKQLDYLKAIISNPDYYKTCASSFGCGTSTENDANTGWFGAVPDYTKAKQLLKEGGYDGRPVVVLQATNWSIAKDAAEILAGEMRRAGINVRLEPMDWAGVSARRAVKSSPDQGGWNVFTGTAPGFSLGDPLGFYHQGNGEKGWYGWVNDPRNEELRNQWVLAERAEDRKRIAREMQENEWNFVPQVFFGRWLQPAIMRANIKGVQANNFGWLSPVWWNVEKV
ncbi:ABC transporter substrate-binding protein [Bradyrhizobium sp. 143]|uniref:ABC transporter substrate-binding protein n=1 Tax=Bradyrhizobium sp. 143 TaxID=2782619 RepID=UPI001FFA9069|nr:ABC transporter substrate-binding protein [Bradyrhizobium sp. 143]MCK1709582.1 ABC transporter substrate-binding protein [Bradyrhizobium sp. 143]